MTQKSSSRISRDQDKRMVHWAIKEAALGMASAYYELAASTGKHCNEFYKKWPNQKKFAKAEWPSFIHYARQCMVDQLKDPNVTERQKEEIAEALCLDATLPYSVQETQITDFRH